jgi:hypothetical protein
MPESTVQSGCDKSSAKSSATTLWTVRDCAAYLRRSPRWLWSTIAHRPEEPGSIPHFRIGSSPRFFPDDIAAWVRQGCPPAATFADWKNSEEKRRHRAVGP